MVLLFFWLINVKIVHSRKFPSDNNIWPGFIIKILISEILLGGCTGGSLVMSHVQERDWRTDWLSCMHQIQSKLFKIHYFDGQI